MRKMAAYVLGLLEILAWMPVQAATHYVSPSGGHAAPFTNWVDAATNIQAAVNACQAGDSVVITDGVYILSSTLSITNCVTVRSENGRDAVLVDGHYPTLTSDAVVLNFGVIDGLTISNAGRHGVKSEYGEIYNCHITHSQSAGIDSYTAPRVVTNSTLIVTNTVVRKSGGYGIYTCAVDTRIENCVIDDSASTGVALTQRETGGTMQVPRVSNFVIRASTISSNHYAGLAFALYWYDSAYPDIPIVVEDCLIEGNYGYHGGGIADSWGTSSDASSGVQVRRCLIRNNTASEYGGGLYLYGSRNTVVSRCTLSDNQAGQGGGVYMLGGKLENCILVRNQATSGGGVRGGVLQNCSILNNTASSAGGGAYASTLYNSIVYYNTAPSSSNCASCSFNYGCTAPNPGGVGNMVSSPGVAGFDNPNLVASSPCIDAGAFEWAAGDEDFDGEIRIWGNGVDIGCDEYHASGITGMLAVAMSASAGRAVVGATIAYEAWIEGKPLGYRWLSSDGFQMANAPYFTRIYTNSGVYSMVIIVSNLDDTVSATTTVRLFSSYTNYVSPSGAHVSPFTNWAWAATTLQAAVEANIPGGEIVVSDGVYEHGGVALAGGLTNRIAITNALVVRSLNGPLAAVIKGRGPNGDSAVRCAYVGSSATLIGFTLTNGFTKATGNTEDLIGGGVRAATGGVISNCVITGNSAAGDGGGAYGGVAHHCCLLGNTAGSDGGGAFGCILDNSRILQNVAADDGGGVYAGSILNCVVFDNSAVYGGGAAWNTNTHCTIVSNTAAIYGGGVYRASNRNSILYDNLASNGWDNYFNSICSYCCTTPDPENTGSFTNAPQLADVAGDYRLKKGSPCIDAAASSTLAADLAGYPRPLDGDGDGIIAPDVGAYEFSGVHYVSSSGGHTWPFLTWDDAAHDIQSAVDAADETDLVLVTNGVYDAGGRAVYGNMTNRVVIDKAVLVKSVSGPAQTRIEGRGPAGEQAVRGVYVGPHACLYGFTISNGCTRTDGDNDREQSGGGVWCENNGTVSNCVVVGNAAAYAGGGAAFGVLRNCLLENNQADAYAGGAYGTRLENCVVIKNTAVGDAGGAYLCTLLNSIVYFNAAPDATNHLDCAMDYSCTAPDPAGTGNITGDPLFADCVAGDYRLLSNSPCIDAGTTVEVAEDFVGYPRPLDGDATGGEQWDMGIYEFASSWVDADGDGLSDARELEELGTQPKTADTDADGQSDGDEVVADVDPLDRDGCFKVTQVIPAEDAPFVFSWHSATGRLYSLQTATNLLAAWTNMPDFTDQPGVAGTMSYTNLMPSIHDFYNVRVRMAP